MTTSHGRMINTHWPVSGVDLACPDTSPKIPTLGLTRHIPLGLMANWLLPARLVWVKLGFDIIIITPL